jgi:hypothetical protein
MGPNDSHLSRRQAITMAGQALAGVRWSVASFAAEPTPPRDATNTGLWSSDRSTLSRCETDPTRASSPTRITHILSMALV